MARRLLAKALHVIGMAASFAFPAALSMALSVTGRLAGCALALALSSTVVRADELADVTRLYKSGQDDEAARRADAFLAANPRDPRMRFLRGVMLMDQKRAGDAQAVFERLTQDYPELPEPYNNLAVLYAAQGDYGRARIALEMVVRTNPGYALAYENLGDVHLKLASQAYGNAQRLDSANPSLAPKLVAIRELLAEQAPPSAALPSPLPAARP